jgi:hypothetical protein
MHAYDLLTSLLPKTGPQSFLLSLSCPMGQSTPVVHTTPIGRPDSLSAHDLLAVASFAPLFAQSPLLEWFASCAYLHTPCVGDPTPPAVTPNTEPPYPAAFSVQVDRGKATHVRLSTLLYKPSQALSLGTREPWRLWTRSSALLKSTKDLQALMRLLPMLTGPYTLVESYNNSNQASLYKAGPQDLDILMADSLSRRFQQTLRHPPKPSDFSLSRVAKLHHFAAAPTTPLFMDAYR